MRKFMLSTMAIAISALVLTSCSKNSDPYVPPTPDPTDVEKYNMNFMNYVGGTIASDQDWGFDASKVAGVRGLTRGEGQGYFVTDDWPKHYTEDFYNAAFQELPEKTNVGDNQIKNFEFKSRGPFRFDIVFAFTEANIEIGYYYYNPKKGIASKTEVSLLKQFVKDFEANEYLQYKKQGNWKKFMAGDGMDVWKMYNAEEVRAKMFTLRDESDKVIDVPKGNYVGFYTKVGDKKYYTNRYLNENEQDSFFAVLNKNDGALKNAYLVGIEDFDANDKDNDCNDIMIAVHKNIETEEPTFPELIIPKKENPVFRILGEDLTVTDQNADFDFNDIVLDVTLTATGADCVLQAAGGQLPIRINGQDDLEVHKLFGVDMKKMVNTINTTKNPELAQYDVKKEPYSFSITGNFSSVKDVKIEVKKNDKWIALFADKGKTACKILITDTSFKWPDERESLKAKYPKFIQWVQKNDIDVWWK